MLDLIGDIGFEAKRIGGGKLWAFQHHGPERTARLDEGY